MRVNRYSTISEATSALRKKGFTQEFKFEDGKLRGIGNDKLYQAKDMNIVEYHRYEGASNPGDMSIVFAVEATDGVKGTVVSAYGAYANMKLVEFMDKVKIKEQSS